MKESLSLLSAEVGVGIAEDETNGRKEITFSGTVAANDHIMLGRKRFNDRLILVA
jgi:hypothetical protein